MNNRIMKISDGRVYLCRDCPYRNRMSGFCGFCMKKVIDDVDALKTKKKEEPGDGIQADTDGD